MPNKYGAKRVEIDGIWFDSKAESNVYLLLKQYFARCEFLIHHPLVFAPATDRFPEWTWKVDFHIPRLNLHIEYKGVRTDEWITKIRAIDQLKPEILKRLIVVSEKDDEKICKGLYTVSLPRLAVYLQPYKTL